MKLPVRLCAIAALFIGIVVFAFSCGDRLRSSSDSSSSVQIPTEVERPGVRPLKRDTKPLADSVKSKPVVISSSLLASESQRVRDAFQRLLISDPANAELLGLSLNRWFIEHPDLALKLVLLLLEGSSISANLPEVEKSWLVPELDLAVSWIDALPPGDLRSTWMNHLGRLYTEVDPLRALTILPTSSSPASQEEFMIQVMGRWTELDPQNAGQHLASMPAGPLRSAAERAYLGEITERAPAAAAAYVAMKCLLKVLRRSKRHAMWSPAGRILTPPPPPPGWKPSPSQH